MRAQTILLAFALIGCVDTMVSQRKSYDRKRLTIQTWSLFHQQENSQLGPKPWKGDWIFRRARLQLIDAELREVHPDIFVVQSAMARKGNPYDSDRNILLAGALAGYQWSDVGVQEYSDTQEIESLATAVISPLTIDLGEKSTVLWDFGPFGRMVLSRVYFDGHAINVYNIELAEDSKPETRDFQLVEKAILDSVRSTKSCLERIVVAGHLPTFSDMGGYDTMSRNLQLVDIAAANCEQETRCYTATPINEIFLATKGNKVPERADRILVHNSTIVYASSRTYPQPGTDPDLVAGYGIEKLWATHRFGWNAVVRVARCREVEDVSP